MAGTVGGAHIPADKLYHVIEADGVQELAAVPANALKTFHEWDWGRRSATFTHIVPKKFYSGPNSFIQDIHS